MKKILLATGCSYTDPNFTSRDKNLQEDLKWRMWPEIVADKLNLECVNKGHSGRGNGYMLDSIIDGIATYGNRIDTVMVAWSSFDRLRILHMDTNSTAEIFMDELIANHKVDRELGDPFGWMDKVGIGRVSKNYWANGNRKYLIDYMIDNSLRSMLAVYMICKAYDIKVVTAQAVTAFSFHQWENFGDAPVRKWIYSHVMNKITKSPHFSKLNEFKKNMVGYPGWKDLNGFSLDDMRYGHYENKYFQKNKIYNVSDLDFHPSPEAQQIMAQIFYDQWKKLYA